MYYKKLIARNKLIKFWSYFGKNIKNVFKLNYKCIGNFYYKNYFLDFNLQLLGIKKILPLFINSTTLNKNILYILSRSFYNQTLYKNSFSTVKKIRDLKLGFFTNFSAITYNYLEKLDFNKTLCFVVLFYFSSNYSLLSESKKKNIPSIGLAPSNLNPCLIDYPVFINNLFFYNIYFFNKVLLKLILINK